MSLICFGNVSVEPRFTVTFHPVSLEIEWRIEMRASHFFQVSVLHIVLLVIIIMIMQLHFHLIVMIIAIITMTTIIIIITVIIIIASNLINLLFYIIIPTRHLPPPIPLPTPSTQSPTLPTPDDQPSEVWAWRQAWHKRGRVT